MASKRPATEIQNYLCYGVDERNRRVYFGVSLDFHYEPDDIGGFSQCSVEFAIRAIERMATEHPKTPIEIHMNSYGGDAYAMLALYDVIHACTCQIKFFGKGAIMSAATWIMCGSDERNLYPNTRILIHNGQTGAVEGKVTDAEIAMEEEKYLQKRLEEIYAENSRMPQEFWHEVCKRDLYLSAEETIFLGLADQTIQPKKRGSFRKKRQHHLSQNVDKRKMKTLTSRLMKRVQSQPVGEIVINTPKQEPIDDRLVIEEIPEEETNALHIKGKERRPGEPNGDA
jgi:ATP-dependent Clp protease protease subunit